MFNNDVRLRALRALAETLAPIEQKKSILYFSAGMQRSGEDNQVELRAATNAAVRAHVSIYPVDTRGLQAVVPGGAPEAYGLAKWAFALHSSGSSGYYSVARRQARDPWRFLEAYPDWIAHQDALHIGTHPPGLFLVARALQAAMEAHPGACRRVPALASPRLRAARSSRSISWRAGRRTDAAPLSLNLMERVRGIEPPSEAWEAPALPLSYTRTLLNDKRSAAIRKRGASA